MVIKIQKHDGKYKYYFYVHLWLTVYFSNAYFKEFCSSKPTVALAYWYGECSRHGAYTRARFCFTFAFSFSILLALITLIAQFAITINSNVCPHIQVLNTLMRESYAWRHRNTLFPEHVRQLYRMNYGYF